MIDDDDPISLDLRPGRRVEKANAEPPQEEPAPEEPASEPSAAPDPDFTGRRPRSYLIPALVTAAIAGVVVWSWLDSVLFGMLAVACCLGVWSALATESEDVERKRMLASMSPKKRTKFLRKEQKAKKRREHEMVLAKATRGSSGWAIVGWVVLGLFVFFVVLPMVFGAGVVAACLSLIGG